MARITTVLRDLRDRNNRTQGYVSSKLGMSQSQYSKLEKGEKAIDVEILVKIGEIFNVQPSQLVMSIYEDKSISFTNAGTMDMNTENNVDVNFYKKMTSYYESKYLKLYRYMVEMSYKYGIESTYEEI